LSEASGRRISWRGFHHVAVVTRGLDETVRFDRDLLGMQAGEVVNKTAQRANSRNCFSLYQTGRIRNLGLHFFESPDAEPHAGAETGR
jgi:catechol 2,3-dioxygenase-like lactoylglutathione lyase family enzyme